MFLKMVITGCAVAAMALAQGGGMGGSGGGGGMGSIGGAGQETGGVKAGGMGPGGAGAVHKETKAELVADRLKLNKEQKNELETLLMSTAKEAEPVVQQLGKVRAAYASALISGKTDADLEPIAKAMAEAQFAMTGVEVRAFQSIVSSFNLKPNQLAKAPEAFDIMGDIFMPQIGAGGGGRGGGMGRGGR
jgi:hypothetical protein